jgi:cytochrome P450
MHEALLSLVRVYEQHGPVFRVGGPDRGPVVLAGPKANVLLAQSGDRYFRTGTFYAHFTRELGADHFVVAMDGAPHRRMRAIMHPAFNWDAISRYLAQMADATRRTVEAWRPGQRVDITRTLRQLITDQTALAMTGRTSSGHFDDISHFFKTAVAYSLGRYAPERLQEPGYRAARQRVFDLIGEILAEHSVRGPCDEPDYIDLLLAGTDLEGAPLSENDRVAAALVPFLAGIDTVAYTCVFLLYSLLRRPALLERVRDEAKPAFTNGPPDLYTLRDMRLLRNVTMETLRMYPVAPAAVRSVAETFEFAGYLIREGDQVILATPVAHFLPEIYPDPFSFDPERFSPPRNEHRKPGAYIPFFKGPHTCIGARMGQIQVMLTIGTMICQADLGLDPPDYALKLVADPILRPRETLSIRVVGLQ